MNKQVVRMLKEAGVWKRFVIMIILRAPFGILESVLTANMMSGFFRIIERGEIDKLAGYVVMFLVLTVLLFAYNMSVWSTIASTTTVKLQMSLRKKVFEKITELPPEELQGSFGADWFTRLNNDVDKACAYLMSPLNYMHMVIAIIDVVISSIIMICMNVELYVIGIVWIAASLSLNIFFISRKIAEYKRKAQKSLVEYTDWIDTSIKDAEMISVFEGGDFVRDKIEKKSLDIMKENMKAHNRMSLCNMTTVFSGMIGYVMIMVRGNDIIGKEMADFAELNKLTQYRAHSMMSVNCIYNSFNNMKGNLTGVERVNEVILKSNLTGVERVNEVILKEN